MTQTLRMRTLVGEIYFRGKGDCVKEEGGGEGERERERALGRLL